MRIYQSKIRLSEKKQNGQEIRANEVTTLTPSCRLWCLSFPGSQKHSTLVQAKKYDQVTCYEASEAQLHRSLKCSCNRLQPLQHQLSFNYLFVKTQFTKPCIQRAFFTTVDMVALVDNIILVENEKYHLFSQVFRCNIHSICLFAAPHTPQKEGGLSLCSVTILRNKSKHNLLQFIYREKWIRPSCLLASR